MGLIQAALSGKLDASALLNHDGLRVSACPVLDSGREGRGEGGLEGRELRSSFQSKATGTRARAVVTTCLGKHLGKHSTCDKTRRITFKILIIES
jgi:hypothetical protein